MMNRGLFRKPNDDDDDWEAGQVVKAKPVSEKYAGKLGIGSGKDFVQASKKSQDDFYGKQQVYTRQGSSSTGVAAERLLTEDEKNKLSAKILKAELKGDKDLARKLKRQLESGIASDEREESRGDVGRGRDRGRERDRKRDRERSRSRDGGEEDNRERTVVMLKKDRAGNVMPASKHRSDRDSYAQSSSRMQQEFGKRQDLSDMVREEKASTAEDQLRLFERSLVKSAKIRRHDDESLDDIAEMQKGRKKYDERDERKKERKLQKEHKQLEQTLDDCTRCLESAHLAKQCVIAVGIHTYLAVVEWDGLDEQHLMIVPTGHTSSCIQLDENVYDEMRLWRKGLVAMWKREGQDCVFFETARHVNRNPHIFVECVPLPIEVGDTAPIYFKKAIAECEREETDNKKLIEIKDLRRQIPKGFSYFAVDFGLQNGYAHVIEDHDLFPANFAHEIIGGMLDLDHKRWKKREKLDFKEQKRRCDAMKELWGDFDWTARIPREDK